MTKKNMMNCLLPGSNNNRRERIIEEMLNKEIEKDNVLEL